jgi:Ca-activated chloride channel family protein
VRVTLPPGGDGAPVMNRDFILRYRLTGDALAGGLMIDEWNGEKFFLLTVQPPARVTPALVPPRDYVFVMDVSGSMWGFPLDVSTRLLEELLVSLREADTFNVQLFSGSSRMLFDGPVAATPENIAAALALFEAGRNYGDYGGATELLPALERALALPARPGVSRSIVVVTDGYVDVEAEAYALVRARLGEANLFAFGIGAAVNRELIERLARAGRSEPAVVDGKDRAAEAAARFRRMIEAPVLTHVRTEFEGFSTGEVIPAVQPDVLAQRPVMMVGKWHGAATGRVRLSGLTGAGAWHAEIDVADAVRLDGRGALAHLWARERLAGLEDLHAIRFEADRQKAEIVRLGLKYNLLTRFTSFVAVDTTPREVRERVKKVTQPNPLPAGVSERALGGEVPTSPEPGTVSLMLAAALVTGWSAWCKRRAAGK